MAIWGKVYRSPHTQIHPNHMIHVVVALQPKNVLKLAIAWSSGLCKPCRSLGSNESK